MVRARQPAKRAESSGELERLLEAEKVIAERVSRAQEEARRAVSDAEREAERRIADAGRRVERELAQERRILSQGRDRALRAIEEETRRTIARYEGAELSDADIAALARQVLG